MKLSVLLLALSLGLAACASKTDGGPSGTTRVSDAATTPLSDLNVVRASIPPVLLEAQKGPYKLPAEPGCAALAAEVTPLEAQRHLIELIEDWAGDTFEKRVLATT